jgi:peptide/nickel transport system ATP-binding protein
MQTQPPLLEIRSATKVYGGGLFGRGEKLAALQDVSLTISESPETITAIAGESGSGKTTLANAVLGFVALSSGQILYRGADIAHFSRSQWREYRRQVQAIFQDPYEVYNPFYRVKHVFDIVAQNLGLAGSQREINRQIEDALRTVGLRGEEVLEKFPHQLSGGQRQRIMVARAYMLKPRLIIADEPVSAVDASLRASILDVMVRLRDEAGISFLYITHDLSTAYQICDDIYVLYQGNVAEQGPIAQVIEDPKHPYVQLLIDSVPAPDPKIRWGQAIAAPPEETPPSGGGRQGGETSRTTDWQGCRFYARCPRHMDRCLSAQPPLYAPDGPQHRVACYLYDPAAPAQSLLTAFRSTSSDEHALPPPGPPPAGGRSLPAHWAGGVEGKPPLQ